MRRFLGRWHHSGTIAERFGDKLALWICVAIIVAVAFGWIP